MSPTDDGHLRKRPNADKPSSPAPARPLRPPVALPRSTSRSVSTALFGFISLAISVYLFLTNIFSRRDLHASYALCAPDGAHIYTVDPSAPRVQCLVVHDSHFIFTGSLGAPTRSPAHISRSLPSR